MLIEMQIRAKYLSRILRNRLVGMAICVPDLPTPFDELLISGQKVVDHLEFGEAMLSRHGAKMPIRKVSGVPDEVDGHHVRITQPVAVYIASHAAIVAGGLSGPTSFSQVVEAKLVFDLTGELLMGESNGQSFVAGAALKVTYVGHNLPDSVPEDIRSAVDDAAAQADLVSPLDTLPLSIALHYGVIPGNFGVAVTEDGTRVTIRLELAPVEGNPKAAWGDFYKHVPDRLLGRHWSVLLNDQLLNKITYDRLTAGLEASADTFELTAGPHVTWNPVFGGLLIDFEGDVVNACAFLDIGVEVGAFTHFGLEPGAPPRLALKTHAAWDPVNLDVDLCALLAGITGGVVGAVIGGPAGAIGTAIHAVAGALAGIVGVAIFAGVVAPVAEDGPTCQQTSPEDEDDYLDFVCRSNLGPIDGGLVGSLTPDQLVAHEQGLLLLGSATVPVLEDQFKAGMSAPLGWHQHLNCNTKGVDITMTGSVVASNAPGIAWSLCDLHFENDPLHFFYPSYTSPTKIEIRTNPAAADAYFADPYPCQLYMRTSSGARWFDFGILTERPEPPPIEETIILWATYCSPAYDNYWGGEHNPLWLIDPDPPWEHTLHRWDVVATGLRDGNMSVLADAKGRVLGSGVVNAAGHVSHASVISPSVSLGGLKLGHQAKTTQTKGGAGTAPRGNPPEGGRLLITQTLLGQDAAFAFTGQLRSLLLPQGSRIGLLVLVTSTGLHVYDLSQAQARGVRLTEQWRDPGLRSVAALADGLLLAGDGGVVFAPLVKGGRLGSPHTVVTTAARGAAVVRGVGCVLDDRGIHVLDDLMRPRAVTAVDAEAMGTLAGRLTVRQREGRLTLFELDRKEAQVRARGSVELPGMVTHRGDGLVGALESPDVVTLPDGATVPVQRDPWLAAAWRFPGHYVHVDAPRGRVAVFAVAERRQTWKSPYQRLHIRGSPAGPA